MLSRPKLAGGCPLTLDEAIVSAFCCFSNRFPGILWIIIGVFFFKLLGQFYCFCIGIAKSGVWVIFSSATWRMDPNMHIICVRQGGKPNFVDPFHRNISFLRSYFEKLEFLEHISMLFLCIIPGTSLRAAITEKCYAWPSVRLASAHHEIFPLPRTADGQEIRADRCVS